MSAATLSKLAVLVAWFGYATAATTALMAALTKKPKWLATAFWSAVVGVSAHVIGLLTIVLDNGRAPWGTLYEWVMSASLVIALAALVLIVRRQDFAALTSVVFGVVVVLMMAGASQYQEPDALQPALQSTWLTFHVALAIVGSGLLLFGGIVSALYLVRHRWEDRCLASAIGESPSAPPPEGNPSAAEVFVDDEVVPLRDAADDLGVGGTGTATLVAPSVKVSTRGGTATDPRPSTGMTDKQVEFPRRRLGGRLPSSTSLDGLARKVFTFAFPIYTLAIFAGAVWGEQAWGRYWAWDPKETTSFVIWGLFAVYLHARATRGWKGTRAAWLGVIGAVTVVFNSFFVNLVIAGLHSYAGG